MMKKTKQVLALFYTAVFVVALLSCSENEPIDELRVGEALQGTWNSASVIITKMTIDGEDLATYFSNLGLSSDFINQIEAAYELGISEAFELDFEFFADGSYEAVHNEMIQKGTWELMNRETQILFDKETAAEYVMDIVELTESRFEATIVEVDDSDDFDGDGIPDEVQLSISLSLSRN